MLSRLVHRWISLASVFLIVALAAEDAFHAHAFRSNSTGQPIWQSHDCSGLEQHGPIGQDSQCWICVRTSKDFLAITFPGIVHRPPFVFHGSAYVESVIPVRTLGRLVTRAPPMDDFS